MDMLDAIQTGASTGITLEAFLAFLESKDYRGERLGDLFTFWVNEKVDNVPKVASPDILSVGVVPKEVSSPDTAPSYGG